MSGQHLYCHEFRVENHWIQYQFFFSLDTVILFLIHVLLENAKKKFNIFENTDVYYHMNLLCYIYIFQCSLRLRFQNSKKSIEFTYTNIISHRFIEEFQQNLNSCNISTNRFLYVHSLYPLYLTYSIYFVLSAIKSFHTTNTIYIIHSIHIYNN